MNTDRSHDVGGQQSPVDRAKNFATFRRLKGGYREELRIGIDTYNGYPYVSLRVWVPGENSIMFPRRVGCSLRKNEILPAIKALQAIAEELGLTDEPPVRATTDRRGPRRVEPEQLQRLSDHYQATRATEALGGRGHGE